MDKLMECAVAYEKLFDVQYHIVIGRKGKSADIRIGFEAVYFHHLIGLHKLEDIRVSRANREKVFQSILSGQLTYDTIAKSRHFDWIQNRFSPFLRMEQLLDDNRLIFRYNTKLNQFSLIEADYLLSTPHKGNDIYIFLAQNQDTGHYFCRSFFPKEQKDYTVGQAVYTMLYKEKINTATGTVLVQYDRLTPKPK